ncbi:hypothetical protein AMTR_s00006p00210580, partial [Amborella trichopoda]
MPQDPRLHLTQLQKVPEVTEITLQLPRNLLYVCDLLDEKLPSLESLVNPFSLLCPHQNPRQNLRMVQELCFPDGENSLTLFTK